MLFKWTRRQTLYLAALAFPFALNAPLALAAAPDLYVVEHTVNHDDVLAYNHTTQVAGFDVSLGFATSITIGPDGLLYVANTLNGGQVYRYDPLTGAPATATPFVVYTGALANPYGMKFGIDANLYITDITQSNIQVFSGATGAPLSTLNGPNGPIQPTDLAFDPVTHALYVCDGGGVEQYNPITHDFFNVVLAATGGPSVPLDLAFGPDDKLYVLDYSTDSVFRYNADGSGQTTYLSLPALFFPNALAFGPDGLLYISGTDFNIPSNLQGEILQVTNGIATPYITGLNNPGFIDFAPVPEPGTLACGTAALALLLGRRRRAFRNLPTYK